MQKNLTIKEIDEVVIAIREKINIKPRIGLILGSGLTDFANSVENATVISFGDLPHFPVSTVKGHAVDWSSGS